MTTVAVLGTGTMGAGMARSLLREGHGVRAWNRSPEKAKPLADDGATVCDTVAEAVDGAEVVVVMVFDEAAVTDVLEQVEGTDAVVLQSSTIGPDGMRRVADGAKALRLLDCPMVGTKKPAEEGKLAVLVSGDPSLIDQVQPVLDAVGAKTVRCGDEIGAASALKLCCNAWIAAITAATAQSLALARAQGVDPALFLEAIDGGAADTPYAHVKGEAILAGTTDEPAFALDGLRKDIALMHAAAVAHGVPTSLLGVLQDLYAAASEAGHGGDDVAAVAHAFAS